MFNLFNLYHSNLKTVSGTMWHHRLQKQSDIMTSSGCQIKTFLNIIQLLFLAYVHISWRGRWWYRQRAATSAHTPTRKWRHASMHCYLPLAGGSWGSEFWAWRSRGRWIGGTGAPWTVWGSGEWGRGQGSQQKVREVQGGTGGVRGMLTGT